MNCDAFSAALKGNATRNVYIYKFYKTRFALLFVLLSTICVLNCLYDSLKVKNKGFAWYIWCVFMSGLDSSSTPQTCSSFLDLFVWTRFLWSVLWLSVCVNEWCVCAGSWSSCRFCRCCSCCSWLKLSAMNQKRMKSSNTQTHWTHTRFDPFIYILILFLHYLPSK